MKELITQAGHDVKSIQKYLQLSCPQPVYRWFKGQILPTMVGNLEMELDCMVECKDDKSGVGGELEMADNVYKFKSKIYIVPQKGGAYIKFPYDIRKEFGKGRVKVHVTFDGIPYDGSIVNMGVKNPDGSICYIIGMLKSIREQLKKLDGDEVDVIVYER